MRSRGFTLLELLISVAILSMVIALSTYSFSLFSNHWNTRERDQLQSQNDHRLFQLLDRALKACMPWVVFDRTGKLGFYFLGREEGMTLVTSRPIVNVDAPAVIRVFSEPDGPGRFKLVYEEASLDQISLLAADQTLPFTHRVIIRRNLSDLDFRFFGWSSSLAKAESLSSDSPVLPQWHTKFDGLVGTSHPEKLSIELDGLPWIIEVPATADFVTSRLGGE